MEGLNKLDLYEKIQRSDKKRLEISNGKRLIPWDGQISAKIDEKGIKTRYTYDSLRHQIKMIDIFGKTTYKDYDLLGRNTAIVSPNNYKVGAALSEMDRTVFVYDAVGRVLEQCELYHKSLPDGNGVLNYSLQHSRNSQGKQPECIYIFELPSPIHARYGLYELS